MQGTEFEKCFLGRSSGEFEIPAAVKRLSEEHFKTSFSKHSISKCNHKTILVLL